MRRRSKNSDKELEIRHHIRVLAEGVLKAYDGDGSVCVWGGGGGMADIDGGERKGKRQTRHEKQTEKQRENDNKN